MKNFTIENLRVTNQEKNDTINIVFDGELYIKSEETEKAIADYFDKLHDNTLNFKNITLDFTHLNAISSYGIRILINWMKKFHLYNETNSAKYKITILYDNQIEWQEATFLSLKEIFGSLAEYKKI